MDGFWCLRFLNDRIDLPNMIRLFEGGTTSFLVAENWTKKLTQAFEEVQGWNFEFKVSTHSPTEEGPKGLSALQRSYKEGQYDRSIGKWRQCLISGRNWN